MKCNICAGEIKPDPNGWDKGHNPWPLVFMDQQSKNAVENVIQ